jgi:hypothetical protein
VINLNIPAYARLGDLLDDRYFQKFIGVVSTETEICVRNFKFKISKSKKKSNQRIKN